MDANGAAVVGGYFDFELVRDGKVIDKWQEKNIVVNEGLNYLLDAALYGAGQETPWYIGIFEGNYTPLATDTAANITANSTESTAYSEGFRQTWTSAGSASQLITNSASKATFTINDTKTIYGAFLVSASAKSATTGTLFAASKFGTARSVIATDELLVTYTVEAATA